MQLLDSADALQKLKYTAQTEDWVIGVVNADGEKCVGKAYTKCDRWWNYSTPMGESVEHPLICDRCVKATVYTQVVVDGVLRFIEQNSGVRSQNSE